MAGESHFVKVFGAWKPPNPGDVNASYQKVFGTWRANHPSDTNKKYVKVHGQWRATETSAPPPGGGDYVLGATSLSIPTSTSGGLAEFNTTEYRGSIIEIRMRISWRSIPTGSSLSVSGRPNSNFYRNITLDNTWSNRTIDHRIDTFDATSLTDFNSGAAIGFNFSHTSLILSSIMTNVQLRLTIS